jgi:hypothetical protein
MIKIKKYNESFDKFITYNNLNIMDQIAIEICSYFYDNDDAIEDQMDDHMTYGIRGDDILLTTDDKFHNSFEWIGDIKTDHQLDGVCAVLLDHSDYIKSIRKAMMYGQHIYLICGNAVEMGHDVYNDEVILSNHQILKVLL